ncbi:MAG: penicillin-binding protein 2 [Acidobacteria bacterium]|nr:penicillin-binding protein 2 [Acidobacteriota bacterium]
MFSESHPAFRSRIRFFYVVVMGVFLTLFFRYWYLQVVRGNSYFQAATENTLREITIPSRRGTIFSIDGQILADYKVAYDIMLDRSTFRTPRLKSIAEFLGLSSDELRDRIKRYRKVPLYKPVPVIENLSFSEIAPLEARKKDYPEIFIELAPQRSYPFGGLFAHTVGYIGEPTVREARKLTTLQKVGKMGIEKSYDDILRGKDGTRRIVVDSSNHFIRTQLIREPHNGKDLTISLLFPLQQLAMKNLGKFQGAVVVLSPRDGRIFALVSAPTFDPNILTFRFRRKEWEALKVTVGNPMLNRAIQGAYPPGSTFKPLVALAGLNAGLTSRTHFTCTGGLEVGGRTFLCWNKEGHGSLSLTGAIAHSCNVYFYNVGLKIGIEKLWPVAKEFGIGLRTGIDIPGERTGLLPTPEWKRRETGRPWFPGDTLNTCIGQGYLLMTPVQAASVTASIANNGILLIPHLINETGKKWIRGKVDLPAKDFKTVKRGMRMVVTGGTGVALSGLGLPIAGKTGTAQTVSGADRKSLELSWFVGFAPVRDPEIAIAVIAEKGGHGTDTAVPIASKIFKFFRDNREAFK